MDVLEFARRVGIESPLILERTPDSFIGWGITGSYMYNLNIGSSDLDTLFLTEPNKKKPVSRTSPSVDFTVTPADSFVYQVGERAACPMVDVLHCNSFHWNTEHPYYPYVRSAAVPAFKYLDNLRSLTTHVCHEAFKTPDKKEKKVRLGLRYAMMERRTLDTRVFRTKFSEEERSVLLDSMLPRVMCSRAQDPEDLRSIILETVNKEYRAEVADRLGTQFNTGLN